MDSKLQVTEKPKKKPWYKRLRVNYLFVLRDDETYEVKLSLRLSRLTVFVIFGSVSILLIFLTTYIIAFTPLREYIPGYADVSLKKNIYDLHMKTDSLENVIAMNDHYLSNIRKVLSGEEPEGFYYERNDTAKRQYADITMTRSKADSLLRDEIENKARTYSITGTGDIIPTRALKGMLFFTPLKGLVINEFNPVENHYGIDIAAPQNEVVKATMDGIVILSSWTIETGYVIVIQHEQNYISIYRHNSVLLKKAGSHVSSGEPIAIVGNTGEFSSGPHLHFELWHNGNPVDPRDYIVF